MDFNESYFEVEPGIKLYFRDYLSDESNAPVVLCLHGLTRNGEDFEPMIDRLHKSGIGKRFRFIVPDMRGRGLSNYDPNPENYFPLNYIADVWELLDNMRVPSFYIVGTSMGGLMAMLMHQEKPERVNGVLLNDIGPMVPLAGLAHILTYLGLNMREDSWDSVIAAMKARHTQDLPDFNESEWEDLAKRSYQQDSDGNWVQRYDPLIREPVEQAYQDGIELDLWEAYIGIDKPTLILRGELSQMLPTQLAEQMRFRNTHCALVEIPRKGHVPQLDEPESLEAISEWLASVS